MDMIQALKNELVGEANSKTESLFSDFEDA